MRAVIVGLCVGVFALAVSGQTVSYFRVPGRPMSIAAGPDGNVWFADRTALTRVTPYGEMTSYTAPNPPQSYTSLASDPAGRLWFNSVRGIDSLDVASGAFTSYEVPVVPRVLLWGPDGNVWFGYYGGIGRMAPSGATTLFPLPDMDNAVTDVSSLTVGPDGNIWFADFRAHGVGRITTSGEVRFFGFRGAFAILPTGDGAFWISGGGHALVRLNTDGTFGAVFDGPITPLYITPALSLTRGPDGNVWFTTGNDVLGIGSPAGIRSLPVNVPLTLAITAGADGNIWAVREINFNCIDTCGSLPPPPALALMRVNLVNPAPRITGVERTFDPATNAPAITVRGLGFVPDTRIRVGGVDRAVVYVSPFEVALASADAAAVAAGGTFVAVNGAPGGGESAAVTFAPQPSPRRRAVR